MAWVLRHGLRYNGELSVSEKATDKTILGDCRVILVVGGVQ